jgi:hypothetical protein
VEREEERNLIGENELRRMSYEKLARQDDN